MPSRRRVLAAGLAALGGCVGTPSPNDPSPSDAPRDGDRPTASPRDPRALDPAGSWPQFGADSGHTGATDAAGVPDDGTPYWHLRRIRSGPPVVADGRLYHIALLGTDPSGPVTRTPTAEGTAIPIDGTPALVCRRASDGVVEWTATLDGPAGGWPVLGDDRVVVVGERVTAFDVATGEAAWSHGLGEFGGGPPTVAGDRVLVPVPGVVDGSAGDYVHKPGVKCYDLASGDEQWSVQPANRGLALAAAGDAVVVLSWDYDEAGVVTGRALSDGSRRWRREESGFQFPTPTVVDGTVYVSASDGASGTGTLVALDVGDGTDRWRRDLDGRPTGAAVADDAVYVGHRDAFRALAVADGSERWSREVEGSTLRPAVADGVVYAGVRGVENAPLRALDAADGSERWSHAFPWQTVEGDMVTAGVASQPVPVDGAVYVEAVDGLYAFGPAG